MPSTSYKLGRQYHSMFGKLLLLSMYMWYFSYGELQDAKMTSNYIDLCCRLLFPNLLPGLLQQTKGTNKTSLKSF